MPNWSASGSMQRATFTVFRTCCQCFETTVTVLNCLLQALPLNLNHLLHLVNSTNSQIYNHQKNLSNLECKTHFIINDPNLGSLSLTDIPDPKLMEWLDLLLLRAYCTLKQSSFVTLTRCWWYTDQDSCMQTFNSTQHLKLMRFYRMRKHALLREQTKIQSTWKVISKKDKEGSIWASWEHDFWAHDFLMERNPRETQYLLLRCWQSKWVHFVRLKDRE